MIVLNMVDPLTLLLMLLATVLLIFLAQELKKSYIAALLLFGYLCALIMHVIQIGTLSGEYLLFQPLIAKCIAVDFLFILISFFSYLWVDDMEARETGKKSIDNSLDWFWKKV